DDAPRYILRLRSFGSFAVGVTVALSHLWQDRDHEGLDPRRGLRRREDQRGRARGRVTSERPRTIAGAVGRNKRSALRPITQGGATSCCRWNRFVCNSTRSAARSAVVLHSGLWLEGLRRGAHES